MKRSEINSIMRDAIAFTQKHQFHLPPFAFWTAQDWKTKGDEASEIVERQLGWDITDFGLGDYSKTGLFIFTIRNGSMQDLHKAHGKVYAEKLLIVDVKQVTPMHFHWSKSEDIINRGGGNLVIQLYNSTPDEQLDLVNDVTVSTDGVQRTVKAGGIITLTPGESITLIGGMYHKFWGEGSRVLVGEVSSVNDDDTDNRFFEPVGRFPDIEEDAEPLYPLVKDYARYYSPTN